MPFAEAFGMDPDTPLPADYLRAIASPEDCRQYLARERPQPLRLGSGEVAVLSSAIFDNDAWVTVVQIADTVTHDVDRVTSIMRRLETKGLVERHDTGKPARGNPRVWHRLRTLDEIEFEYHGR